MIKNNVTQYIDEKKWSLNSSDLNILDYDVWDAIGDNMHWDKVKNYNSLIDEIKKALSVYQKMVLFPASKIGQLEFYRF
jgi:hypothetical protein